MRTDTSSESSAMTVGTTSEKASPSDIERLSAALAEAQLAATAEAEIANDYKRERDEARAALAASERRVDALNGLIVVDLGEAMGVDKRFACLFCYVDGPSREAVAHHPKCRYAAATEGE